MLVRMDRYTQLVWLDRYSSALDSLLLWRANTYNYLLHTNETEAERNKNNIG